MLTNQSLWRAQKITDCMVSPYLCEVAEHGPAMEVSILPKDSLTHAHRAAIGLVRYLWHSTAI